MKEIDFRVGDLVFNQEHGNGKIDAINRSGDDDYPLSIGFECGLDICCTKDGKQHMRSPFRSIFHGHNLEITVKEKLPVRTVSKWVYLFVSNFGIESSAPFDSEECCKHTIKTSTRKIVSGPIEIKLTEEY